MKIIVGLGNPGKEFEKTRHNIGFEIIDELINEMKSKPLKEKNKGLISSGYYENEKIIFVKPQTFMNNSGEYLLYILNYFEILPNEFIVIYDDITMEIGKIRFRKNGSDGGHNGIKSIINWLKTSNFDRLKIGVGHDRKVPLDKWVIGKFNEEEIQEIENKKKKIIEIIFNWIKKERLKEWKS